MGITTNPVNTQGGEERDSGDYERLRHARDRSFGFPIGQYTQPAPLLFTRDGHNVFLGDLYRGHSAFLVCGGPSLTSHDLTKLHQRGILMMAVNNAATVVRPQLWCSVDDPGNFSEAIWYDAGITKFVPLCHMEKTFTIRGPNAQLLASSEKVGDMPSVFGFRRNEAFAADQFLTEDTFNWGNQANRVDALGNKGGRSVMYVAIRLLYYLGIRAIYLLGCDFKMQSGVANYAFPQDRSLSSVRGNNDSYRTMNSRFTALQPHFERAGLRIYNCNPNSELKAFPHLAYDDAIRAATDFIPKSLMTEGMYDRKEGSPKKATPASKSCAPATRKTSPSTSSTAPDDLTLVIPVNPGNFEHLKASWPTWVKLKPWIRQLPTIVLRHADVPTSLTAYLHEFMPHAQENELPVDEDLPNAWERQKLQKVAQRVGTKWYWMLDPSAVATSPCDWMSAEYFRTGENQREPVFMACSWEYTKPADAYAQLDAWADGVSLFESHPRLAWQVPDRSDRIRHSAISSWSFVGNTAWMRKIGETVRRDTPVLDHSTFVLFCAERMKEAFHRVPMKQFGWDHSFSWRPDEIQRKCQNILQSQ